MIRNDFTFIRRLEKLCNNPRCSLVRKWSYLSWIEFLKEEAKYNYLFKEEKL
jgi:hypothetical protein